MFLGCFYTWRFLAVCYVYQQPLERTANSTYSPSQSIVSLLLRPPAFPSLLYNQDPCFRVASTPGGLAGCYVYQQPPDRTDEDPGYVPNFKEFPAEVQVYDIKQKILLRTISDILGGYVMGGYEFLIYKHLCMITVGVLSPVLLGWTETINVQTIYV